MVDIIKNTIISSKERRKIRDQKIRALYRKGRGYSMDEIVLIMKKEGKGVGVSKTTVFFAINGRSIDTAKKMKKKREVRKGINNLINKNKK